MNGPLRSALFALAATIAVMPHAQASDADAAVTLPGDSVYHLDAALADQDGQVLHFADGRGRPRLVSMFYTSCQYMCPLIIDTIRKTEHALPEAARQRLEVLLISFDSERDTPLALKAMADKRRLDTPRWTLARADAADIRRIAAVLDIQYRQMQDHEFSHSSALILLDNEGRIVARTDRLGEADPDFVAAVMRQVGTP